MINNILASISAGNSADIFNDKEVNVAIKSTWIYNKSDSDSTYVTISFAVPEQNTILNIEVKPGETIFIDSDLYVPIGNYLIIESDTTDVNVSLSFIEDSRTNTIV